MRPLHPTTAAGHHGEAETANKIVPLAGRLPQGIGDQGHVQVRACSLLAYMMYIQFV
jgi:hypothetical protein